MSRVGRAQIYVIEIYLSMILMLTDGTAVIKNLRDYDKADLKKTGMALVGLGLEFESYPPFQLVTFVEYDWAGKKNLSQCDTIVITIDCIIAFAFYEKGEFVNFSCGLFSRFEFWWIS